MDFLFEEHITFLSLSLSLSLWRCSPTRAMASSFLRFSRSHKTSHHSRQDSSGRVTSSPHRPLPDNTQHSQQTNIHAPGGIRTHSLRRRTAADVRLRPRGHWDRHHPYTVYCNKIFPIILNAYIPIIRP